MVTLGSGSTAKSIAMASGREPIVVGKPEKIMFETILRDHPCIKPERTIMVGDK